MFQYITCPKHKKRLIFFKETSTHNLFKCPDCDYTDGPGVVRHDLPERYIKLQAENKRLKEVLMGLHFCRCGCDDDNIKAVEQVLKGR